MRYVGKSKISKIHPKPNASYPLLRLPQAFNDFVGKTTRIFETDYDGKLAFIVVLDKNNDRVEQVSSKVMKPVMQLEAKDTQQYTENSFEARLSALENVIKEIRNFLFQNKSIFELKKGNEAKSECRGGVAWPSYGPVEATTRVRIPPSAFCLGFFWRLGVKMQLFWKRSSLMSSMLDSRAAQRDGPSILGCCFTTFELSCKTLDFCCTPVRSKFLSPKAMMNTF
jgi:hypothetical protein